MSKTKKTKKIELSEQAKEIMELVENKGYKSGLVVCVALIRKASLEVCWELTQTLYSDSKIGEDRRSCQEQRAWYKSQLRRGLLCVEVGENGGFTLINLKSRKNAEHRLFKQNNLDVELGEKKKTRAPRKTRKTKGTSQAKRTRRNAKSVRNLQTKQEKQLEENAEKSEAVEAVEVGEVAKSE